MTTMGKVAVVLGAACALLAGGLGGCSPKASAEPSKSLGQTNRAGNDTSQPPLDRARAVEAAKAVVVAAVDVAMAAEVQAYPGPDTFKEVVRPKLAPQDAWALDAFVWTFPGGKMVDIESPTTTEVGHVVCPEGRAVAYADGSVKVQEE